MEKESEKLLGVCIPTFSSPENPRHESLRLAVETYVKEAEEEGLSDDIKITISTGNKPAHAPTVEVIKQLIKDNPGINIETGTSAKHTVDYNLTNAVKMAKNSRFVLTASDDDFPQKGSLRKIVDTLQENPDISILSFNYSRRLIGDKEELKPHMISLKDVQERRFSNAQERFFLPTENSFFPNEGENRIPMASTIYNTDLYLRGIDKVRSHFGRNILHCFVSAEVQQMNPNSYYLDKPLMEYTAGRHRIWSSDIWKEYLGAHYEHLINLRYRPDMIAVLRIAHSPILNKQYGSLVGDKLLESPVSKAALHLLSTMYKEAKWE